MVEDASAFVAEFRAVTRVERCLKNVDLVRKTDRWYTAIVLGPMRIASETRRAENVRFRLVQTITGIARCLNTCHGRDKHEDNWSRCTARRCQ